MRKIYSLVLIAAALLVGTNAWAVNITSRSELQSFLTTAGTNTGVIAADLNLSDLGQQFVVAGTKELTINNGVTLSLKSAFADKAVEAVYSDEEKLAGFCFRVPNGAKLTLKGNGTIAADRSVVLVEKGGELVIGEESKASQLHVTTFEARVKNRIVVVKEGTATIYNANMLGRNGVLWNSGTIKIDGGIYHGQSSYSDNTKVEDALQDQYTYAFNSRGIAVLKNATFLGCHGSVSPEENGRMDIDNCTIKTDPANGAYSGASSFHGLYICTYGIATVRNSKLYSKSGRALWIGNNDKLHTFGLAYIYENVYFKGGSAATNYPYLQPKTYTDDEALFPVEIDKESDWYKIAATGSNNVNKFPLPIGYAYRTIIASGEPTAEQVVDAEAYAEGYRVKVVSTIPAEQQEAASVDPSATIPWQQETTWSGDVPAATDVVTIPEGKTVVIKNDEATTDVQAAQVKVEGEGASLTVEEGTTLTIGQSLNITAGAKLIIEPGARVTVGEGGVITSSDDAIEVKTSEGATGVFMLNPDATENTRPMAKVEFSSRACTRVIGGSNVSYWQRFASPVFALNEDNFTNNFAELVAAGKNSLAAGTSFQTRIFQWDYINNDWERIDNQPGYLETIEPFRGYTMTNNSAYEPTEAVTYTFEGNLVGNNSEDLSFTRLGFNYFGNSYTAPINIKQLLASVKTGDASGNISYVLYVWDVNSQTFIDIPFDAFELDPTSYPSEIPSMHTFIMQCLTGTDVSTNVDYRNNVWGPLMNPGDYAAPARSNSNQFSATARITITADNGETDRVLLMESNRYTDAFDNGADATKYMNDGVLNVYATADFDNVSTLATDNLAGTFISMQTKETTNYVMTFSCVNGAQYAIKDMLTNTVTLMSDNNSYAFSTMDNETIENRFQIIGIQQMPTDVEVIEDMNSNAKGIYTLTGQYIGTEDMWYNLPKGMYILNGQKVVK